MPDPVAERLVKIALICAALNLQFTNETVWLIPVQATDARDGQAFAKFAILAVEETADKSKSGSDESEEHWLNIWLAFVHDDIFRSGGCISPVQLKNIC